MKRDWNRTVPAASLELPIKLLHYVNECFDHALDNNLLARDSLLDAATVLEIVLEELKQLNADALDGET